MPIPFVFKNLPRVTRSENELLGALRALWQRIGFAQNFTPRLEQMIAKNVGLPCAIQLDRLMTTEIGELMAGGAAEGAYLLIGLTPMSQKVFAEVDLYLAHSLVDRLLGGTGEASGGFASLTEVESGVLSYLILKILSQLHEAGGSEKRLHFRLEEVARTWRGWEKFMTPGERAVALILSVVIGPKRGYVKLLLPQALIQKGFIEAFSGLKAPESPEAGGDWVERFGWVQTRLWGEVGRTTLSGKELRGLAKGDVLLLDKTEAFLQEEQLSGNLVLHADRGQQSWRGKIISVGKHIEVSLCP